MRIVARTVHLLVGASCIALAIFGLVAGIGAANELHMLAGAAFLLAGWFPVVLVHELGHAVAAKLVGWRVAVFHVMPWTLRRRPFALRLDGQLGGPDVAGSCWRCRAT